MTNILNIIIIERFKDSHKLALYGATGVAYRSNQVGCYAALGSLLVAAHRLADFQPQPAWTGSKSQRA